jgi:hypothetical protein
MSDAAINHDLPALKWRGMLAPPYDLLTFKWRNRLAPRQFPGVDVDAHDPTGRDSFPMTARLYFVNTSAQDFAGLGRLFPDYWETWRDQLLDGAAGDLEHPLLGPLRARVAEGGGVLETRCQSGLVIDVTWWETNEDPSVLTALGNIPASAAMQATQADTTAAAFGVSVAPDRLPVMFEVTYGLSFPSGFSPPTLSSIFAAIQGPVFAAAAGTLDMLSALMGDVAAMVVTLQQLNDCGTWPALDACMAFWFSLYTMRKNLGAVTRPVASVVVDRRTMLDAFAYTVGNSVAEIMSLNAAALTGPFVDRGTTLSHYLPS